MSININNGVANNNGTPGAYTGDFGNAPAANAVAAGTLYFDNIAGNIYQSDGISWKGLGGSGGAQNLQQVLTVGNTAINQFITLQDPGGGHVVSLYANATSSEVSIQNGYNGQGYILNENGINYNINFTIGNINTAANLFFEGQTGRTQIGDINNNLKGDYLFIDNTNEFIKTYMSNAEFGLFIDRTTNAFLGDYGGAHGNTLLSILDSVGIIEATAIARITLYSSNGGLSASSGNTIIGDHDGQNNSTTFGVDDNNENLTASANLIVSTSGSSSGQHLKINVGGNNYVIELKNP